MSEFHVTVVKLGPFVPHPNADTLDITKVFDYQVIVQQGNYNEGDLVAYIPIDSVVPDTKEWHWLAPSNPDGSERFPVGQVPEKYRVIGAKKIRGIFSQGMLAPLPQPLVGVCAVCNGIHMMVPGFWVCEGCNGGGLKEGDDIATVMNITKYEPPQLVMGGECEAAPSGWTFPIYTDIEGLRRYPDILQEDEEVVITEKIHGANARYVHDGERLWAGSHTQIKKNDKTNLWWKASKGFQFENAPFHVFFGEVYGQVQDLKYDIKEGVQFRAFDVYDVKQQKYLDHDDAIAIAAKCNVPWVPTLYRGPWSNELNELCEGNSTFAKNVREGFVVKPVKERWNQHISRVILKRHGEGYLLRKKK